MSKSIRLTNLLADQNLRDVLSNLQTTACDMVFNTAGLTIGSSSKAKPKIANTIYALINSVLVKKTTAEITLTTANNVANAKFNVIVLSMNASGTVTPTNGTAGDTIGAVVFPAVPANEVVIGFVIINPTGTGGFVGGTTELDDATVVPNAVYVNTPYPFNVNAQTL